jgi:hypothetical protein
MDKRQDIINLRGNVASAQFKLKEAQVKLKEAEEHLNDKMRSLFSAEATCNHVWREPVYAPEHQPGYHLIGDPEGTMGVDRQLPMNVLRRTIPKWTRTCLMCDKKETTDKTLTVAVPSF